MSPMLTSPISKAGIHPAKVSQQSQPSGDPYEPTVAFTLTDEIKTMQRDHADL